MQIAPTRARIQVKIQHSLTGQVRSDCKLISNVLLNMLECAIQKNNSELILSITAQASQEESNKGEVEQDQEIGELDNQARDF